MFEHCFFNALHTWMRNDKVVISGLDHLCHRSIQEIAPRANWKFLIGLSAHARLARLAYRRVELGEKGLGFATVGTHMFFSTFFCNVTCVVTCEKTAPCRSFVELCLLPLPHFRHVSHSH